MLNVFGEQHGGKSRNVLSMIILRIFHKVIRVHTLKLKNKYFPKTTGAHFTLQTLALMVNNGSWKLPSCVVQKRIGDVI